MRDEYDDDYDRPRRRYRDYDDDGYERDVPPRRRKTPHSGPGIVGLAFSLIAGVTIFITLVVAGVIADKEGDLPDDDPRILTIGFFILGAAGLSLIGGILGIVGVCTSNRTKVIATIGLAFNACIILGVIVMVVAGAML